MPPCVHEVAILIEEGGGGAAVRGCAMAPPKKAATHEFLENMYGTLQKRTDGVAANMQ